MLGLNKSDLAGGARWIRDHFSNWFANSFVMAGMFGVIILMIGIGMYFDGEYAQRWAPEGNETAKKIFKLYGWGVSLTMIFATSVGIKAIQEGARWAGGIMLAVGLYFTLLSVTQSVGVVTIKAQEMVANSDAFAEVKKTDTGRLDFLKSERQLIIDTRDAEILRIQSSIDAIEEDGIPGIPKADQDSIDDYNARIDRLRDEADGKIILIGDEIKLELETPQDDDGSDVVAVAPARFDPGVDFWSFILTGKSDADDTYKQGLTNWYMLFWSVGSPMVGLMLSVYLVITRRTADRAEATKAKEKSEPHVRGAETRKRRARQSRKIEEQANGYLPQFKKALRYAEKTRWPVAGIAENAFPEGNMDYAIGVLLKAGLVTEEEVKKVRREDQLPVPAADNSVDIISQPLNGSMENDDADDASRSVTD
ncbi:MAG: hypothetical protein AAGF20_00040 [Pseudomonadota bacterium]